MDPNSDCAVAKAYGPLDRLTYLQLDLFHTPSKSMAKCIRKRVNKTFHSKETLPQKKRQMGRVVQGVIDSYPTVKSLIEDLESKNLQEGYNYAEECVKTQSSKVNLGHSLHFIDHFYAHL